MSGLPGRVGERPQRLQQKLRWKQLTLEDIGECPDLWPDVVFPLGVLGQHSLGGQGVQQMVGRGQGQSDRAGGPGSGARASVSGYPPEQLRRSGHRSDLCRLVWFHHLKIHCVLWFHGASTELL